MWQLAAKLWGSGANWTVTDATASYIFCVCAHGYFSENYLNKAQVCCMSVCWATQHSNKKTKPEYSLGSFVGRPSGVLMGFYFFFFPFWLPFFVYILSLQHSHSNWWWWRWSSWCANCQALPSYWMPEPAALNRSTSTKFGNCCSYFGQPGGGPGQVKGVCCSRGPLATPCHLVLRMLRRRGEVHFRLG